MATRIPPEDRLTDAEPSTAAIRGHPIHPMLIPFPMAFLTGAFGADVGYWLTADPFWARAALWLIGAGVVSGLAAAVAGLTDFLTIAKPRKLGLGWIHAGGNAMVLLLAAVNWGIRSEDAVAAVLPWGIILSFVIAVALGVTGWAGAELSYRYRIGVTRRA